MGKGKTFVINNLQTTYLQSIYYAIFIDGNLSTMDIHRYSVFFQSLQMSDSLQNMSDVSDFASLQYALYITCFASAIGGAFFLATTLFVHKDRLAADRIVARECDNNCFSFFHPLMIFRWF